MKVVYDRSNLQILYFGSDYQASAAYQAIKFDDPYAPLGFVDPYEVDSDHPLFGQLRSSGIVY